MNPSLSTLVVATTLGFWSISSHAWEDIDTRIRLLPQTIWTSEGIKWKPFPIIPTGGNSHKWELGSWVIEGINRSNEVENYKEVLSNSRKALASILPGNALIWNQDAVRSRTTYVGYEVFDNRYPKINMKIMFVLYRQARFSEWALIDGVSGAQTTKWAGILINIPIN